MKILFWFRTHEDDPANTGVIEKCRSVVRAFAHQDFSTTAMFFSENGIASYPDGTPQFHFPNKKRSFRHLLLFYFFTDRWLSKNIDFQTYSHFYIRHFPTHPAFINLLKFAKKQNPSLQIVIELPTWPYDAEAKGLRSNLVLLADRIYRKRLHRYTDFVIHFGTEKTVWGIPVINLSNGIEWQNIPVRNPAPAPEKTLRLLAVGNWNYWHGLDRVLAGVRQYLQSGGAFHFQLVIVGEGPAIADLKKQAGSIPTGLTVDFDPPCTGAALDHLFDHADLGIGVLGLHRKGLSVASPLKHREYCARGLPFLMAGRDTDFEKPTSFILTIADDDSPVDMQEVIDFVKDIKANTINEMRSFTEKHLGWDAKIRTISERYFKPIDPGV